MYNARPIDFDFEGMGTERVVELEEVESIIIEQLEEEFDIDGEQALNMLLEFGQGSKLLERYEDEVKRFMYDTVKEEHEEDLRIHGNPFKDSGMSWKDFI